MRPIVVPVAAVVMTAILPTFPAHPAASGPAQPSDTGGARTDTGIEGQVIIRPIRPHETVGTPNVEPYQATVQVLDTSGHPVTTFQSEAGGTFRVALPPGRYVLQPQSPGLYPRASEQTVVVPPTGFTQVRITYNSGIR